MKSDELNTKIAELADNEEYDVKGLEGTSKCIPYIGWFWRSVNFDKPFAIVNIPDGRSGWDKPEFVGFMMNNKWGYPSKALTREQCLAVKALLEKAVNNPSNDSLQAVFDYMQTFK